jgi:iron complex transport system substrate-binding protein
VRSDPHPRARPALALLVALCIACVAHAESPAQRVVSLNPSLTSTLIAIGAGPLLVGIDEWSARVEPSVASLPRVGGLFNPSLEAIIGLEPDLVVLVPSAQQRNLRARLEALGVEVLALSNISLDELLASIEVLGSRVGRAPEARARVAAVRAAFAAGSRAAGDAPRDRAVLVIQRDPLYVVGGGSFLDSMLTAVGVHNIAGDFDEPYPRVGVEWLIAEAPEVILDASDDPMPAAEYWSRWPSLPAVVRGRVVESDAATLTLPGPHLDRALESLARALRGGDGPGES